MAAIGDQDLDRGEAESSEDMASQFFAKRRRCFCVPCFGLRGQRASEAMRWERIGTASGERHEARWWSPGIEVFKKLREWSEMVAGPRWKTFIRRLNRGKSCAGGCAGDGGAKAGMFQYDAYSYALNFDEGAEAGGGEADADHRFRNFSSRYASIPVKAGMGLGNGKAVVV